MKHDTKLSDFAEKFVKPITLTRLAENDVTTAQELVEYELDEIMDFDGIGEKSMKAIAKLLKHTRDNIEFPVSEDDDEDDEDEDEEPRPSRAKSRVPATEVQTEREYTVTLQNRHANFVDRLAQMHRLDPSKVIEKMVREAYAADPSKGGEFGGDSVRKEDWKNPAAGQ